jgi:hypothetical protein
LRIHSQFDAANQPDLHHSGADDRAAMMKHNQLQVEDEKNDPDWLAEEAVVL